MTQVIFIEKLVNGSYSKVVTTSSRSAEKFCVDAAEYYASIGIETEVRCSTEDPRFVGVFSVKKDKLMAVAGPEKNEFFWRKHTLIKKNIEEANGVPKKPAKQKHLFYAVISKDFTGYIRLWSTCEKLVKGKKGGVKYKGFSSLEAAAVWMRENGAPDASYQRYKTLEDIK